MNAAGESVPAIDRGGSNTSIDGPDSVSVVRAAALKLQSQHVWPVLVSNLAISVISAIVVFVLWPLADRSILLIWAALSGGGFETNRAAMADSVGNIQTKAAPAMLRPGGLFTSTEFSLRPGGDMIFPVPWAYDASISFIDPEDVMRSQFDAAGFRVREWTNYTDTILERAAQTAGKPSSKLAMPLVFGEDTPERQRNSQRNLIEKADHLLDDHGRASISLVD